MSRPIPVSPSLLSMSARAFRITQSFRTHCGPKAAGPISRRSSSTRSLTFRELDAFADLAPYGVNAFKADYVPWAWQQSSDGDHVYALPWDSGPIGQIYRKDILDAHGMQPAADLGRVSPIRP